MLEIIERPLRRFDLVEQHSEASLKFIRLVNHRLDRTIERICRFAGRYVHISRNLPLIDNDMNGADKLPCFPEAMLYRCDCIVPCEARM